MKQTEQEYEFVEGVDFYFDENNLLVMTSAYLLKRGSCCQSNCRHCPYGQHRATKNSPLLEDAQ